MSRRSTRSRRWLVPVLVAVCLSGACRSAGPEEGRRQAGPNRQPRFMPVIPTPSDALPPTDYLADRTLHLTSRHESVQLAVPPHPALQGTLAPLVVPSPDGTTLAYSTFDEEVTLDPDRPPSQQGVHPGDALGTPAILLHDIRTGTEQTLARGAYSPAWRRDGALAFVAGTDPMFRAGTTYTGSVMVLPPGERAPEVAEQWTASEGRYVVAGWAGTRLLVYHTTGNESFDLEVLDGPGEVRTLAPASALLALSPDGTRAAIATSANGWSSHVQILDLATGDLLLALETDAHTSLVYGGSWMGSRLVARGGDERGPLVDVFTVGVDTLRLERVVRVDANLPNGLVEPKLDPKNPDRLAAWSFVGDSRGSGAYVLVTCDLPTSACTSGPPVEAKVVRLYSGSGV